MQLRSPGRPPTSHGEPGRREMVANSPHCRGSPASPPPQAQAAGDEQRESSATGFIGRAARQAEGEAQGEGEDRDLGVVGEQEAGQFRQPLGRRRLVVERRLQEGGRGHRVAPMGHVAVHEAREPVGVAAHQDIGHDRRHSRDHERRQGLAPQGLRRRRPVAQEEPRQPLRQPGPRAIDEELGPRTQALQIGRQALVQRDRPRHRQGRQRLAVEQRDLQQLVTA